MTKRIDDAPEADEDGLRPFVFDVASTPGFTNVDLLGTSADAPALLELLGRDLGAVYTIDNGLTAS